MTTAVSSKGMFVRFKVSEEKLMHFITVFNAKSVHSFDNSLFGASKDSGSFILTFLFKVDENNSMKEVSEIMLSLSYLFSILAEYYPSFAEKPSDMQNYTAHSLIRLINKQKDPEETKNKTQKQDSNSKTLKKELQTQ